MSPRPDTRTLTPSAAAAFHRVIVDQALTWLDAAIDITVDSATDTEYTISVPDAPDGPGADQIAATLTDAGYTVTTRSDSAQHHITITIDDAQPLPTDTLPPDVQTKVEALIHRDPFTSEDWLATGRALGPTLEADPGSLPNTALGTLWLRSGVPDLGTAIAARDLVRQHFPNHYKAVASRDAPRTEPRFGRL